MPRLCPTLGEFIVHKGTTIFPRKVLRLFLQATEVASVFLVVDSVIQRHEVRIVLLNIV